MELKIRFKKILPDAFVPTYGSDFAAGADLHALTEKEITVNPGQTVLVHTGIALEIPEGTVGLVFARSGLATKQGLAPANKVGVIDSDYRGEIMVSIYNQSNEERIIKNGDRIAQISSLPYYTALFEQSDLLDDTGRGEGGFGSTGIN